MDARWISSMARSTARMRVASCGYAIGASSTWPKARRGRYIWCVPILLSSRPRREGILTYSGGHRGNVRASIHQVGRCISEARTRFGRWTAQRKRCARTGRLGVVKFLFLRQESSYIARICHYLESCLSTSRRFFLTAITVSACVPVDRRALLMYSSSPILYLHRRRLPTRSCPWFLFKGNLSGSLVRVPYLT
jgi:hypothetical protein